MAICTRARIASGDLFPHTYQSWSDLVTGQAEVTGRGAVADGRMAEYTGLDLEIIQHGYLSQWNPRGKEKTTPQPSPDENLLEHRWAGVGGRIRRGRLVTVIWSFESCDS